MDVAMEGHEWTATRRALLAGVCAGLLLVGLVLRLRFLDAPQQFLADERVWLMAGRSLMERGVPVGWSIFGDTYEQQGEIVFDGERQVVVTPYLDHPPLFALGMGVWASIFGGAGSAPLSWVILRLPMVGVAMLTIVLTAALVYELLGTTPAVLTLAAFSVFPAHVAAARFVTPENVIALLLVMGLFALALLGRERDGETAWLALLLMVLISAAAPLLKLSGLVVPAMLFGLALVHRRWKVAGWVAAATLLSGLLLAGYGAAYDWQTFLAVLREHSSRPQSFWHPWTLVADPDLGYWQIRDPALIVGWLGLFGLAIWDGAGRRARLYAQIMLLNLLLLFLFVAPVEAYGWYRYVWFPPLAMGLGFVAAQILAGMPAALIIALPMMAVLLQYNPFGALLEHKAWLLLLYGMLVWLLAQRSEARGGLLGAAISWSVLLILFWLQVGWGLRLVPLTALSG